MPHDDSTVSASDIAIIGYSARFPGAENAAQFWQNLCLGVESIRPFTATELESVGVDADLLQDPDYVRAGAPLSQLDAFDAGFFGISPREAAIMDPQQRFFLESTWEALEHAGYAPGTFAGSIGVFAGSGPNSYLIHNLLTDPELLQSEGIFLLRHTGNDKDVLATRLSYQMNLRGPSLNIQTACSTSLVAVHYACQSLLHYGCDMAIAGAVSIEIPHAVGYHYRQNEIQSHDGHCRAFDANATGTVFGSGLGIVILRRLTGALADGDTIHAVIKGSAVNNDGSRKVGFLAPSVEGQVEVILEAVGAADVTPESIDYVETHGTGTPIGDPIELGALGQAFAERQTALKIGSVKTNIGHLDTAAGMAGLLKTVLALGHRQIPPTLHFKNLNPLINTGATRLQVVDKLIDWQPTNGPLRAGVTSLGIGGTNAHIILEEAPPAAPREVGRSLSLLTFSAKTAGALDDASRALATHLRRNPGENLDDIAYTLHVGRSEFAHRRAIVAANIADALQILDRPHAHTIHDGKTNEPHGVAFLFSGQGTQYVNMGLELYQTESVFKLWIDTCADEARPHLKFDIRDLLFPTREKAEDAALQLKLTWNAQPILFAVEYALAQLWISWGVRPNKLIGHSLGEYAAACLSGIFSLQDALAIVCARGNLLRQVNEGAMLAVSLSELEASPWTTGSLSLAAVNGPKQCVISGLVGDVALLREQLAKQGIACQQLETSHAFHSSSIDPVLDLFTEIVREKTLLPPQIPLISNVTGKWLTKEEATSPAYWAAHFRQAVRFAEGFETLQTDDNHFLLEIGPGETLCALARQNGGKEMRQKAFATLPRPSEKSGDLNSMLNALGHLWVNGVAVDWHSFHEHERLRRVPLPTYPFQRKRFWMGPKIGSNWLEDSLARVDDWYYRTRWKPAPLTHGEPRVGSCLVLADDSPENRKLLEALGQHKADLTTVFSGNKFSACADNSYVLDPASESDYIRLIDDLVRRRRIPGHIVYLWGLNPSVANEERCFHGLLHLIQALGARLPDQAIALTALSHRAVSVSGETVLHSYGSLLGGPCRVTPIEYPHLRCRQVDVDSIDPIALAKIIQEETASETTENLAAYRNGERSIQVAEQFQPESVPDRLREGATYLITGGLGGIGMAVADWLARTYRPRLILLSRRGESKDPAHQARFDEWRALGAEVLSLAADVTNRESLKAALDSARKKFGSIHGIIHAAGVLQDGIIQLKKKSVAHDVLAPKTTGVELLDELTRDQPLDFFALFSSVSAFIPPDGQVDYCAANAFLNAFAQSRPAERKFIVIGWGPWAEVGMVAPKPAQVAEPVFFQHPLLNRLEIDTTPRTVYLGSLSVERNWVLAEHHFHGGDSLLPGTAFLEIALTALWKKIGRQVVALENVVFVAPLRVQPNAPIDIEAELRKSGSGYQFAVTSHDTTFVSGQCRPVSGRAPQIKLKEILGRCTVKKEDAPKNIRQRGHFDFGPRWQSLRHLAFGKNECLGTVELLPEYRDETRDYALHPALMDIATGVAMYLIPGYEKPGDLLLPFAYKRLKVFGALPSKVFSHARLHSDTTSDLVLFDITLMSENGEVVAEVEEFTVKRLRSVADLSQLKPGTAPLAAPLKDDVAEPPHGIPTREGLRAFQRILKSEITDVIYVSPTSLSPIRPMKDAVGVAGPVTAGTDDINLVLEQLWQRLLGLDHVDAATDFFDSGGHSLLAVRLFTEIRKRFNIDFGLSTLFEARTIGALAELIRKAREADPERKTPLAHNLVPIRTGGTNTPLFLIHDVGGTVLRYEHLARHFPDDQAIYAIESRGLSGLPTDYSVEAMARHYIRQIRERQSHGPYYVAGHSFGGLVAYEIACQLTDEGESMGLVGLLDTFQRNLTEEDALHPTTPVRTNKLPVLQRLAKDARALVLGRDRIGYLQERHTYLRAWAIKTLYRTAYKLSSRFGWQMPPFLNDVKEANWIAADYYTPRPYAGAAVLFRCLHRLDTDPPDSSRIWKRLVRGGVTVLECPGDHNSMLREPSVAILAEQILSYLKPQPDAMSERKTAPVS